MQSWLRDAAMEAGVTMIDPGSVFLCRRHACWRADVTIGPNVVFGPGVTVASRRGDPRVQPPGRLQHRAAAASSARSRGCVPARCWREDVHVGNFVELKAATLGRRAPRRTT